MHRHMLHNDSIVEVEARQLSAGQVGFMNGWGVFSTLRVFRGVLFAFGRHWDRMRTDAHRMHVPFPQEPEWLRTRLLSLVEANRAADSTLRVAIVRNQRGPFEGPGVGTEFDLIAFTTPLTDWPDTVSLAVKPQARHAGCEFAGAKITSWAMNLVWNEQARERGYDEVVLLNEHGEVSECTSANIFVLEGEYASTPPLSSGCLPGITRALLLEELRIPGLTMRERTLLPSELESADAVFITSSTRDALPVGAVEGMKIRTEGSAKIAAIREAFTQYRVEYCRQLVSA